MDLAIAPIIPITVVCYLIGIFCKAYSKFPDKYIPVVVGVLGGILGLVAYKTIPGWPVENWLAALEMGIVSGLASTGVNQVFKQLRATE